MMPLMPPQLTLWGSPLYNELCVGLCRALAAPWLGSACPPGDHPRPAQAECRTGISVAPPRASSPAASRRSLAARSGWLLLDSQQSEDVPIRATSLAELSQTVRDLKGQIDDGSDAASLVGEID